MRGDLASPFALPIESELIGSYRVVQNVVRLGQTDITFCLIDCPASVALFGGYNERW